MWFTMLSDLSERASKGVYRVAKKKTEELFRTARTCEFGLHGCQYCEWFLNKSHLLCELIYLHRYKKIGYVDPSGHYKFSAEIVASLKPIEDTISSMLGWRSSWESSCSLRKSLKYIKAIRQSIGNAYRDRVWSGMCTQDYSSETRVPCGFERVTSTPVVAHRRSAWINTTQSDLLPKLKIEI